MSGKDGGTLARRDVLKTLATVASAPLTPNLAGATAATAVATIVAAQAEQAPATPPSPAPIAGYQSLSPDEAAFVEALVNVMCPADQFTPNGVDCGLATFI